MSLLKKRTVLAAAVESVPGTPVATTAIANVYDLTIDADIPYHERMSQGSLSRLVGVPGTYGGSCKFKIEAYGGGSAGTSPAWATTLLAGCGMTASAGVWSPISAWASQSALTLAAYEDGVKKELTGAMGTWSFNAEDGKPGYFEFDFKGIWVATSDAALLAPVFSTVIPPRFAGATLTIGSFTPTASKISVQYGNEVGYREDVTKTSGFASAIITGRKVSGSLDPELTTVATYDAFGIWQAGTTASLTCTLGSSGSGLSINLPVAQYSSIKEGNRNDKITSELSFVGAQNGNTVDSEITITF